MANTSTIERVRATTSTTSWEAASKRRFNSAHGPSNTDFRPAHQANAAPRVKASAIHDVPGFHAPEGPGAYTQHQLLASTPRPSQDERLTLSWPKYNLPQTLCENLRKLGVALIYPWQATCLSNSRMLAGTQNLVYTAPTGGGKSLVGDVLMFKRVIERKKALLVLPYVALVQEKLRWLRRVAEGVEKAPLDDPDDIEREERFGRQGIRVAGYFGGSQTRETWADVDIAVCTIEKANGLINAAIDANTIDDLGIVVLDELHMIDDEHRGYLLELMATKLLSLESDAKVQLIGMSATLANTQELANWLGAKFYESKYRPVPIEEFLVCDLNIHPVPTTKSNGLIEPPSTLYPRLYPELEAPQSTAVYMDNITSTTCRTVDRPEKGPLAPNEPNAVVSLAIETAMAGYGALIFCNSRPGCQATALLVSKAMPIPDHLGPEVKAQRQEVINTLHSLALLPIDPDLAQTIPYGVAFHHAGMTTQERQVVAEAYDKGLLKVIVATCSLAAGINLPARRVILNGARMGRQMVGPAMLRQMRGRAGRKGKDEVGESYVVCKPDDLEEVCALLAAEMPPIESSLAPHKRGIKRALLEVIAVRLATHTDAIQDYIRRTLLFHTTPTDTLEPMIADAISYLMNNALIEHDEPLNVYTATPRGSTIVAAGLTPADGLLMHNDLLRARENFVLDGELHVFYIFAPFSVSSFETARINWSPFYQSLLLSSESDLRVATLVGVKLGQVEKGSRGAPMKELNSASSDMDIAEMLPYYRLYAALQLRDLCAENALSDVSKTYGTPRGNLQQLLSSAESTAAAAIMFCERLEWGMLGAVLAHMRDRLRAGARADLLELARIPFVKSRTARLLWENGYKGLRDVAEARVEGLVEVLLLAQPRRNKTMGKNEEGYRRKLKERAETMVSWAGRIWERERERDEGEGGYY